MQTTARRRCLIALCVLLGAAFTLCSAAADDALNREAADRISRHRDDLDVDAVTFLTNVPCSPPTVWVTGTARSRSAAPGQPGSNGYQDWVWCEALGEQMALRGIVPTTGAGPGAMEATLVGYHRALRKVATSAVAVRPGTPVTDGLGYRRKSPDPDDETDPHGAAIRLATEQQTTPELEPDDVCLYRDFLYRMKHLFATSTEHINTPGGLGTTAEFLYQMTERVLGRTTDRIFFGSPDDYFTRLNAAFMPFMGPAEREILTKVQTDPRALADALADGKRGAAMDEPFLAMLTRMCEDLRAGLDLIRRSTAAHGPAVSIIGGGTRISRDACPLVAALARDLTRLGVTVRVGGSPALDEAVLRGAREADPKAEVQAFALDSDRVSDAPGMKYLRVHDFLVLNELLATGCSALVVTPDGSRPLATLFISACDIQTAQLPRVPLVVVDASGRFEALRSALRETMLSASRRYINPEDTGLFLVARSSQDALRLTQQAPTP